MNMFFFQIALFVIVILQQNMFYLHKYKKATPNHESTRQS